MCTLAVPPEGIMANSKNKQTLSPLVGAVKNRTASTLLGNSAYQIPIYRDPVNTGRGER